MNIDFYNNHDSEHLFSWPKATKHPSIGEQVRNPDNDELMKVMQVNWENKQTVKVYLASTRW